MTSFRTGSRWRRALLFSLGLHVLMGLAVLVWPASRNFVRPVSSFAKRPPVRLHRPGPAANPHSGEESSGEESSEEGGGFRAAFRSDILIEPRIGPSPHAVASPLPPVSPLVAGPGKRPGSGKGGPGAGSGNGTRFFQVETTARRIVYVLDVSSSMGRDKLWDRACREVIASLDSLPADARFQVIVYHARARPLLAARPDWLPVDAATLAQVRRALIEVTPEGRTEHAPALSHALTLRPDVIFFLTDADDLTFPLLSQVARWNTSNAVIHTFELNRRPGPRPPGPLQQLAQRHGGKYRVVE